MTDTNNGNLKTVSGDGLLCYYCGFDLSDVSLSVDECPKCGGNNWDSLKHRADNTSEEM